MGNVSDPFGSSLDLLRGEGNCERAGVGLHAVDADAAEAISGRDRADD